MKEELDDLLVELLEQENGPFDDDDDDEDF